MEEEEGQKGKGDINRTDRFWPRGKRVNIEESGEGKWFEEVRRGKWKVDGK